MKSNSLSLIVSDRSDEFSQTIRNQSTGGQLFCSVVFGELTAGGALLVQMNEYERLHVTEYEGFHIDVIPPAGFYWNDSGPVRAMEIGLFLTRTVLGLQPPPDKDENGAMPPHTTLFDHLYLETEYDLSRYLFHLLNIRTSLRIHVQCRDSSNRNKYAVLVTEFQNRFFVF
jgi:hypothetical protein